MAALSLAVEKATLLLKLEYIAMSVLLSTCCGVLLMPTNDVIMAIVLTQN